MHNRPSQQLWYSTAQSFEGNFCLLILLTPLQHDDFDQVAMHYLHR